MFDEKNVEAYMLLVVEHGADEEVLHDLTKIEGIAESSLVYGEYDIHCKLSVESMEKLREVHDKVRKLRILTSETLIAYEKAPRRAGKAPRRAGRVTNRHVRKMGHKRARH